MKITHFLLILVAFCALSATVSAQTEKEVTVKAAHALETDPLSSETASMEKTALKWVIETDQVNIIACGGVFSLFSDKKNKSASDMTAAYTIGMAAFKIEHPESSNDENAAQLAGLTTALKAYSVIIKTKPKNKFEPVDALVDKMNNNQLAEIVDALNCGRK
jgi:hypothetical protein